MPRFDRRVEVGDVVPPTSLSVEDYVKLVERVRKGKNDADINIAFERIVSALKPRIRSLCSKFYITGLGYDDIYQEALDALWSKAIKDYDKSRSTDGGIARFDSFAIMCICRHLLTKLKSSHQVGKAALNTAISLDQERSELHDDLSLINILPDGGQNVLTIVERKEYYTKLVARLLGKLSKFEREVFMLFIEKYSYQQISEIINRKRTRHRVNVKGVDNALSRIKTKARGVFDKFGDKDGRARRVPEKDSKSVDKAISRIRKKAQQLNDSIDMPDIAEPCVAAVQETNNI
jgi:RNA polymerase sporulation-specific sigma factor